MTPAGAAAVVVLAYLAIGIGLAQYVWREVDRDAEDTGHYVRAIVLLIVAWPKALFDLTRRKP